MNDKTDSSVLLLRIYPELYLAGPTKSAPFPAAERERGCNELSRSIRASRPRVERIVAPSRPDVVDFSYHERLRCLNLPSKEREREKGAVGSKINLEKLTLE